MLPKKNKFTPRYIVFVVADTLRAKNVGLYGARPSPTPVVDKFGKKSVVFANAYTSITKTDPSITAIMTGRYPMSTGLISHGRWLIKEQEARLKNISFLAEILQKNGFTTAAIDCFARWHARGFSYYSGKIIKDVSEKRITSDGIALLKYLRFLDVLSLRFIKRDFFARFYYSFFSKTVVPYDPADVVIDDAITTIEKNSDKKLFLYVHFRDPHFPHIRPKGLRSYLFDSIEARYDAEVKFMDQQIGRLLNYLDRTGIINETLFIFTADHGESLREHGVYVAHHDPYENVVKIPLLLWHPQLRPKKIHELVQNIDIFPTILQSVGVGIDKGIDGKSLVNLAEGKSKKGRDFIFFDDNLFGEFAITKSRRKVGVRMGNYKYIRTLQGKDEDLFSRIPINTRIVKEELYDLVRDPEEKNNLINTKKNMSIKLSKVLQSHINSLVKMR